MTKIKMEKGELASPSHTNGFCYFRSNGRDL